MKRHEYLEQFIKKHNCDFRVETGTLDGTTYHKQWIFDDGAIIFEVNDVIYDHPIAEVEVHGMKIRKELEIPLNRCEMWNTDDSTSVFFYERIGK